MVFWLPARASFSSSHCVVLILSLSLSQVFVFPSKMKNEIKHATIMTVLCSTDVVALFT